jgi:hypothetical protein
MVARAFDKGKTYGDEYRAVMTITVVGSVGHCTGLSGKLRAMDFDEMLELLADHGITELVATRHGRQKHYRITEV